jgi:hypothetical protein
MGCRFWAGELEFGKGGGVAAERRRELVAKLETSVDKV